MPDDVTYEPLALKYRPRRFSDMVGQEHVTGGLAGAIEGGRLAHAYLFCGPRGTGKTTTARILARCLNCELGLTAEPDGTCASCEAILAGASLDVLELDAASQRKVEDTEDWVSTVHLVPMGRHKVYIVDEVHMFSKASFNLLLKTFEEPPAHVVFVLATTEPEKVPATVRGRCQRFDFRLVPHEVLVGRYLDICRQEGIEPEPGALEMVARQAAGSVRDGLTLMEQALSDDGCRLEVTRVQALTGAVDRALVVEAVDLMAGADAAGVFGLVARVAGEGADLRRFTEDVVAQLRGVMISAAGSDPARLLDGVDDQSAREMTRQGKTLGVDGATARLLALAEVAREVDNEGLGRITLEAALVRCCLQPDVAASLGESRDRSTGSGPPQTVPNPSSVRPRGPARPLAPAAGPPGVAAPPATAPLAASEQAPPPDPGPTSATAPGLADGWADVVAGVGRVAQSLLEGSRPLALEDNVLRIGVDAEFRVRKLAERKDEIDGTVSRVYGAGTKAEFVVIAPPAPTDEPVDDAPEINMATTTEAPPPSAISVVDLVKKGFAAEIVEESP